MLVHEKGKRTCFLLVCVINHQKKISSEYPEKHLNGEYVKKIIFKITPKICLAEVTVLFILVQVAWIEQQSSSADRYSTWIVKLQHFTNLTLTIHTKLRISIYGAQNTEGPILVFSTTIIQLKTHFGRIALTIRRFLKRVTHWYYSY
jgi:hypothetical protein